MLKMVVRFLYEKMRSHQYFELHDRKLLSLWSRDAILTQNFPLTNLHVDQS